MTARLLPLAALALLLAAAGCGGSKNASSSQSAPPNGSGLVTKVEHATAKVEGRSVVGTVTVMEGGKPGRHLSLRYGLVDAVSGVRASQEEQLVAKYVTTAAVATKDVRIQIPKPTPTDYLIHFVLYGPDGSYLASSDSDVFTVH